MEGMFLEVCSGGKMDILSVNFALQYDAKLFFRFFSFISYGGNIEYISCGQ